ncbi:OPT superfamily oligopeptide transporter, partial [Ramicandelaber brevisporus]
EWVRLTVKDTDDPTLSAITIRSVTLCILLGAMRQIVREYVAANASWLGSSFDILAIILAYPLGCLMANYLPARKITLYTRIRVSLNPGPFNIKEYGCIAVFIGAMLMRQSMIDPISMVPVDVLREITSLAEPYPYLLILSCHLIALGLATLLHYAIVQPSSMVYYQVLPKVAILQYLATQSPPAKTPRRWLVGLAGVIAAVAAAASAMVPLLDAVAPLCYITKSSVSLQQLGSGDQGLGLLSFSTNWRTITSALGSPLAMPFWAIVNLAVGFVICAWVLIPIAYSVRAWNAQKFPIYSAFIYNDYGTLFDRQSILPNGLSSSFYSPQFTVSSVIFLAFSLAASTSVLSHFWLYHRRVFLQRLRGSKSEEDAGEDNGDGADGEDIHMRLIRRYPIVPAWWGITVLAVGLLLAAILSFAASTLAGPNYIIPCSLILGTVFLAPIATIAATTGFVPSTHLLFAILPTFFNPGSLPVNAVFHVVGTTLITSTVVLFMNAKLAHYLKIPPRTMFLIQLGGLSYSAVINAISTFLVIATRNDTVRDISICDSSVSYAWQSSCLRQVAESEHYLFLATYNPIALLGLNGTYRMFLTLFALGFLLPFIVYFTMRLAAPRKWRRYHGLICVPLFLGAAAAFPMNPSSAFLSWFVVGVVASRFLYKRFTAVWAKYVMVIALVIVAGYAV